MARASGPMSDVTQLVLNCSRTAFAIQKMCQDLGADFPSQVREKIDKLLREMFQCKDISHTGTNLREDIDKLAGDLDNVITNLQTLIPLSKETRPISYGMIQHAMDAALERIDRCYGSFQNARASHLNDQDIHREIHDLNQTVTAIKRAVNGMPEMVQQQLEVLMPPRSVSASFLKVAVRCLGGSSDYEDSFALDHDATVARIIERMRDEEQEVENIHFFSWSAQRHKLTENGHRWKYRRDRVPIARIAEECGTMNGQPVTWRLEYVCNPDQFTLFLVHGLQQENGLPIPLPIESVENVLKTVSSSNTNFTIMECKELKSGRNVNWNDPSEFNSNIRPYTCSLCIRLAQA